MYDDDLTTLMHDATAGLKPPVGAARIALRAAAVHRRRTAVAAGGSTLAVAGLIGAGAAQLPGRAGATIQVASGDAGTRTSTGTCAEGPGLNNQTAPPMGTDPAFTLLSLPQALPRFPINLWTSPANDSYQGTDERLWGWDAKPYVHIPGTPTSTPGGPQIRLVVRDAPNCFAPDSNGFVEGRAVSGQRTVLGETALISRDKDDVWLSLSTANYSIEGQGGSGATVDDLVMEIEAIQGLDDTASSPVPSAATPSPTVSDSSPGLVTSASASQPLSVGDGSGGTAASTSPFPTDPAAFTSPTESPDRVGSTGSQLPSPVIATAPSAGGAGPQRQMPSPSPTNS